LSPSAAPAKAGDAAAAATAIKPTDRGALDTAFAGITVMSGHEAGCSTKASSADRDPFASTTSQAVVLPSQTAFIPFIRPVLSRLIVAISDDIASS
jgi:hypothetical protein